MTATVERTETSFYTLPKTQSFGSSEEQPRYPHIGLKYTSASSGGVDSRFLWQQRLLKASKALLRLRILEDDWDSYGGRVPGEQAVINALSALSKLGHRRIIPDRTAATDDGSVLMEYTVQGTRYWWECEEDGDIGLLVRFADGHEESADFRHSEIGQVIDRFHNG